MKLKTVLTAAASAAVLFCGAAAAHADMLKFTWVDASGTDFSFFQDSNPTPTGYDDTYTEVHISGWTGAISDAIEPVGSFSAMDWIPSSDNGGFELFDDLGNFQVSVTGPQVFGGSDQAPVFAPGVFSGTEGFTNADGTLTITEATAPGGVPEPTAWAMLLIGVGAIGVAMRTARRRERTALAAA